MRILHVLAQLPRGTGSGVYFTNLIKELKRYEHDQCAVFALQDHVTFQELPADRQYPVHFKTAGLPFPVPGMSDIMPYDSTRYGEMSAGMTELWRGAFGEALQRAAADFRPDVLILHHLWMLTSLALELCPGIKSVGVCHHTDLRQAMRNPELKERRVTNIHQLDTIISLSDIHQAEIRAVHPGGPARIVTVGGGFDGSLFFPAPNRRTGEAVKILYAGKIDPSKGVFALIEAFLSLRRRDRNLSLSIVGTPTGEYADRLNRLAESGGGIHLSPSLTQEELARTMRAHDVFVMPSFFEGLGLIAIEALASGLWTVATEIEGLISLLGDRVVQSGAVEFVALPPMERAGLPHDSQLPKFIQELTTQISRQIARARRETCFPESVYTDVSKHCWEAIAARINSLIHD